MIRIIPRLDCTAVIDLVAKLNYGHVIEPNFVLIIFS